jgi:hypothetical protein
MTRCSAVGSPGAVQRQLAALVQETDADELILATQAYDHAARLRSFEIAAGCFGRPANHAGTAAPAAKPPTESSPIAPAV